jgi:hypothetical protein
LYPLYLTKKTENWCSHKKPNTDVYRSFIHNCQNMEATKMSFSEWIDKWTMAHLDNGLLFSTKKKWTIKP